MDTREVHPCSPGRAFTCARSRAALTQVLESASESEWVSRRYTSGKTFLGPVEERGGGRGIGSEAGRLCSTLSPDRPAGAPPPPEVLWQQGLGRSLFLIVLLSPRKMVGM